MHLKLTLITSASSPQEGGAHGGSIPVRKGNGTTAVLIHDNITSTNERYTCNQLTPGTYPWYAHVMIFIFYFLVITFTFEPNS